MVMKKITFLFLFFFSLQFLYAEEAWHKEGVVSYRLDKERKEAEFWLDNGQLLSGVMKIPPTIVHENVEYKIVLLKWMSLKNVQELWIPYTVRKIEGVCDSPLLKKVVLARDLPVSIFENSPFEDLDELVFDGGEPENFIQIGNVLYSRDFKTIYHIAKFDKQRFVVPQQVENLYLNISHERRKKLELVLHKNVRKVHINSFALKKELARLYFIVPLDDSGDESHFFWNLHKLEYRAPLTYNSDLENLKRMPSAQRYLKNFYSLNDFPPYFLIPDFSSDVKQLDLRPVERKGGVDSRSETITESGKKHHLRWDLLPVNVRAIPKEGKRIVGYVSFNDTIAGDTCTILNCFEVQTLKVLSADETELVKGIDYRLSQNLKTMIFWRSSAQFEDLRKSLLLQDVESISKNALTLNANCEELFLPNKTRILEAFCVKESAAVKKLGLSPLTTSISQDAFLKLPLLRDLYIPGMARMESTMLDKTLVLQRSHLKHIYVDKEHFAAWKDKFAAHPLSSYLTPVSKEINITNTAADKVEILVKDLTLDKEFTLNQEHPSLSLPRTTHVKLQWKPLPSYNIQQPLVNETVLETDGYESFLVEDLKLSSRGEVVTFSVEKIPSSGGTIHLFTEDGHEIESGRVLRGTKLHVRVVPNSGYIFRTLFIDGATYEEKEKVITVRNSMHLMATYYRPKALLLVSLPPRCSLSLTDSHGSPILPEHVCVDDEVYIQKPSLPAGMQIDRLDVDGVTVITFPYRVHVKEKMEVVLTVKPLLHTLTLTPKAAKYIKIFTEDGIELSEDAKVVDQTKCQISYVGQSFERLDKCVINTQVYLAADLPLAFTISQDVNIDVVVSELHCRLFLSFPPHCSLFMGGKEITTSPYVYDGKYMEELQIRVQPQEQYYVKGYSLDGVPYLGNELTLQLKADTRLVFDVCPKSVSLATKVEGKGKLLIEDTEGEEGIDVRLVSSGTFVRVSTVPDDGYYCERLLIDGVLQDSAMVTFQPFVDAEIQAIFKPYILERYDGYTVCRETKEIFSGEASVRNLRIVEEDELTIVPHAFERNGILETLRLEKGVTSIGEAAFANSGVRMLHLGQGVSNIDELAFASCAKLRLVELEHRNPTELTFADNTFPSRGKRDKKLILRVPNGTADAFKNDKRYRRFTIVENSIQCTLEGTFFTEKDVLSMEHSEYWETLRQSKQFNKGVHAFLGGTKLRLMKKMLKTSKDVELFVNGKRAKLPATITLLAPTTITLNLKAKGGASEGSNDDNTDDEGAGNGNGSDNDNNNSPDDSNPTEITEVLALHKLVYPNPTTDFLRVSDSLPVEARYQLVSLAGNVLQQGYLPSSKVLDVQALPAGVYILNIVVGNQNYTTRFLKR